MIQHLISNSDLTKGYHTNVSFNCSLLACKIIEYYFHLNFTAGVEVIQNIAIQAPVYFLIYTI